MKVFIPIVPKPTPRPRLSLKGSVYYADGYKEYLEELGYLYLQAGGKYYGNDRIKIRIEFCKNIAVKKRNYGDIDNLVKGVLDALSGVAYNDDCQVVSLVARKTESDLQGVYISISTTEGG